jgi:hypothetical protein
MKWHAGSVADTAEAPPMPDRIAAMQRTGKECQKGTSLLEGCSLLKAISEHWNQKSWSYFLGHFDPYVKEFTQTSGAALHLLS